MREINLEKGPKGRRERAASLRSAAVSVSDREHPANRGKAHTLLRGWVFWSKGYCWILACTLVVSSAFADDDLLFPPQCNVVLLSGIPGDSESENTYRDHLRSWLEVLRASGGEKRLFVLCDNPQTAGVSAGEAKLLKGDRQGFKGLAGLLSGTTPVVVIAWGHGGRQGTVPVFHVSGPRLTPADFSELAAKVPAVESRWILLFRGSGQFARQLLGKHRQVISSDQDTAFTSDPIGMSVLLRLLRGQSLPRWEPLADQFGRTVASWYEERHLARTEEPTLWTESGPPRLLANLGESEAGPGKTRPDKVVPTEQPGAITASTPKDPEHAQNRKDELPGNWKAIQRVDAQKHPDADAIILLQHFNCTLGRNPALVTEQDEYIQILTPEGNRFGDFDVSYSPPDEEVEFLACEVLRLDGTLARLDPDAVSESHEQAIGDYHPGRRKFFSLPGVGPGSVLHVHYRTQWTRFPLPQISMELPLGQEVPARDSTLEVSVPQETPFHFTFEQVSAPDPEIKRSSYSTMYSWHFKDLPASGGEVLAPPRQRPRLMFSTFADWTAFQEWYGRISQLADEVTPEIAAKAQELTKTAKDDRAKVIALYDYVTALRYVAIPLGVNSFRPHAAGKVLQNQFGDCKDKANLFNALLHSLNIDAHLVLVPRFGQAYDSIPGFAFNHAISRVALDAGPVWVDTTDDICRFGLLPPGDSGRKVLVVDGRTAGLVELPVSQPKDHVLKIQGRLDFTNSTGALPMNISVTATGYPDYALRAAAQEIKEHRNSFPLLATRFRPASGSFALERQRTPPVSALDQDFSWEANGTVLGLVSVAETNGFVRSPFWLPKEWDQALHHRQAPLFLNQGYPLTFEQEFEMKLPSRARVTRLPEACGNDKEPLRWRIEWARIGDDRLAAKLHVEIARGELSAEETHVLQQELGRLLGAVNAAATVQFLP